MLRNGTLAVVALLLVVTSANADMFAPPEAGSTLNGYQDSFDTLSMDWTAANGSYTVNTPGILTVEPGDGESHLFYTGATYNDLTQEVLALVRPIGEWDDGPDGVRGGVAVNGTTEDSQAYNFLMRRKSENVRMLDDGRAWGPNWGEDWTSESWYWIRFKNDGAGTLSGKFWAAGTEEPTDWLNWGHDTGRAGFAGIAAGTATNVSTTFEVDYFLLKASGLPEITVVPEPASLLLLSLGLFAIRRR